MEGLTALDEAEATALAAVHARLVPSDETGPGAAEAQAVRFVDRLLAGPAKELRESYAQNLAALDSRSKARHGARFAELGPAAQDAVLTELEIGDVDGFAPSSSEFFELVRLHAIQGVFADPSHGGNAGGVGWNLLGFPGVKVVFTEQDQQLDAIVEPVRDDVV